MWKLHGEEDLLNPLPTKELQTLHPVQSSWLYLSQREVQETVRTDRCAEQAVKFNTKREMS